MAILPSLQLLSRFLKSIHSDFIYSVVFNVRYVSFNVTDVTVQVFVVEDVRSFYRTHYVRMEEGLRIIAVLSSENSVARK